MSLKSEKKDNILKVLVGCLGAQGFKVRREILKSGIGWRAVSGSCTCLDDKMIFLDRRLAEDEQIEFLIGKFKDLKIKPETEVLDKLPEFYRSLF